MITVPEATEKIIKRSRYLSEAISKDLINLSALAIYITPEIEEMLIKKVSKASVIMAIRRTKLRLRKKPQSKYKDIFKSPPEMIIRSNLSLINLMNSDELYKNCVEFFNSHPIERRHFFTLTEGSSETTIALSTVLKENLINSLGQGKINLNLDNLSSITIQLPKEVATSSGIFYFFLKSLAWEEINVVEIISTSLELTFIFDSKDINKAFSVLKALFN